jgi:hypothetical protein
MIDVRPIRNRCQLMVGCAVMCQAVGHQLGTSRRDVSNPRDRSLLLDSRTEQLLSSLGGGSQDFDLASRYRPSARP